MSRWPNKRQKHEWNEQVDRHWRKTQRQRALKMLGDKVPLEMIAIVTELSKSDVLNIQRDSGIDVNTPPDKLSHEEVNVPKRQSKVELEDFLQRHKERGIGRRELEKLKMAFGMIEEWVHTQIIAIVSGVPNSEVQRMEQEFFMPVPTDRKTKPLVK